MGVEGLSFAIREALSSIRRNSLMSVVAISTVAISLFILASVLLLSVNLDHMAGMWESQVHLRVYLVQNVDARAIKEIQQKIEAIEGVTKTTFVSKEEALERLKKQFGEQKDLLAGIEGTNPLPNSFEIGVNPPQKIKEVASLIEKIKGVEKVQYRQEIVDKLFKLTAGVRLFGLALLFTMGAATVFIISNTIRVAVFSRRREIAIMKLVGATDALIRGPFVIEGMVLGLAGSVISSTITWLVYSWVFHATTSSLPFLPLMSPRSLLWQVVLGLVFAGSLIGATGSGLSLRRYLRV